ncbi:hypothetical protein SELMODRAFT_411299 [Selaginella moellendorffii]|uniref:Uncharacterized protein n=1 Tax=Selaginella moellendorffii TaxID=88036 RepID=D8RH73_SELML|nr:hypothetical protein SELMODRAFT_411299 [Selaginella moellendorffii]
MLGHSKNLVRNGFIHHLTVYIRDQGTSLSGNSFEVEFVLGEMQFTSTLDAVTGKPVLKPGGVEAGTSSFARSRFFLLLSANTPLPTIEQQEESGSSKRAARHRYKTCAEDVMATTNVMVIDFEKGDVSFLGGGCLALSSVVQRKGAGHWAVLGSGDGFYHPRAWRKSDVAILESLLLRLCIVAGVFLGRCFMGKTIGEICEMVLTAEASDLQLTLFTYIVKLTKKEQDKNPVVPSHQVTQGELWKFQEGLIGIKEEDEREYDTDDSTSC